MSGCGYSSNDWECREGGYLFDAGTGEGWCADDTSEICPCCRTKDYLEAAKDEAESCSSYSNNGSGGTGLTIWNSAEREALEANKVAAIQAMSEIGIVHALEDDDSEQGYSVVMCNTQEDSQ